MLNELIWGENITDSLRLASEVYSLLCWLNVAQVLEQSRVNRYLVPLLIMIAIFPIWSFVIESVPLFVILEHFPLFCPNVTWLLGGQPHVTTFHCSVVVVFGDLRGWDGVTDESSKLGLWSMLDKWFFLVDMCIKQVHFSWPREQLSSSFAFAPRRVFLGFSAFFHIRLTLVSRAFGNRYQVVVFGQASFGVEEVLVRRMFSYAHHGLSFSADWLLRVMLNWTVSTMIVIIWIVLWGPSHLLVVSTIWGQRLHSIAYWRSVLDQGVESVQSVHVIAWWMRISFAYIEDNLSKLG